MFSRRILIQVCVNLGYKTLTKEITLDFTKLLAQSPAAPSPRPPSQPSSQASTTPLSGAPTGQPGPRPGYPGQHPSHQFPYPYQQVSNDIFLKFSIR